MSQFDIRALTADQARTEARQGLVARGHTVRALGRGTRNEFLAYIVHPSDVATDAQNRRG